MSLGFLGGSTASRRLTEGGVVFDETAGLKQVYVHRAPDPAMLLRRYYEPRPAKDSVRWRPSNRRVS